MPEDYRTEQDEDDYEEWCRRSILKEASIFIVQGMTRNEAINRAEELAEQRFNVSENEVVRDEDGVIDIYLVSDLEPASSKGLNQSQIRSIYTDLCKSEDIFTGD